MRFGVAIYCVISLEFSARMIFVLDLVTFETVLLHHIYISLLRDSVLIFLTPFFHIETAILSGAAIPILSQVFTVYNIFFLLLWS